MTELSKNKCEACHVDAPKVDESEFPKLLEQIPEWQINDVDGIKQLERKYKFKNFVKAMEFANKVGDAAEEEGHHPGLLVEWGKVTVTWWSHSIKGLHFNDFIMAAKTDELFNEA